MGMSLSKDKRSYTTDAARPSNESRASGGSKKYAGVVRGLLVAIGEDGTPKVDFDGNPESEPIAAVSTVTVTKGDAGREAVLMFEDGDARRPILLGLVKQPGSRPSQTAEVSLDGEQVTVTADREVVLRCGHASIILTRAGKVLIRGKYVMTRSSGVNRIKGGSVQIN
jgi:Domain of unknown function (DUF6484)